MDSVVDTTDCSVTMIQSILLSGRYLMNCLYLGRLWLRLPLLKLQRIITKESGFVPSQTVSHRRACAVPPACWPGVESKQTKLMGGAEGFAFGEKRYSRSG